jgi:hypothetical protein
LLFGGPSSSFSRSFGDQRVSVGQKRQRPGMLKPFGQCFDLIGHGRGRLCHGGGKTEADDHDPDDPEFCHSEASARFCCCSHRRSSDSFLITLFFSLAACGDHASRKENSCQLFSLYPQPPVAQDRRRLRRTERNATEKPRARENKRRENKRTLTRFRQLPSVPLPRYGRDRRPSEYRSRLWES